jgi:hypothetical protein
MTITAVLEFDVVWIIAHGAAERAGYVICGHFAWNRLRGELCRLLLR